MKRINLFPIKKMFVCAVLLLLLTANAYAYVDPGALGSAYQFGYLIFYSLMGALVFFFKPVKTLFVSIFKTNKGKNDDGVEIATENAKSEAV